MPPPSPSQADRQLLLREASYHKFILPGGEPTPGLDRSATASAVFGEDLSGLSLLDIGCGEGFYLIEAKRRGAGHVVGVEADSKRFRVAQSVCRLFDYPDITLLKGKFPSVHLRPRLFDLTLLMNVVHHQRSLPAAERLILQAARLTRRRLVLCLRPPLYEPGVDPSGDKRILWMLAFEFREDPLSGRRRRRYRVLLSRDYVRRLLEPLFPTLRFLDASDYRPGRFLVIAER